MLPLIKDQVVLSLIYILLIYHFRCDDTEYLDVVFRYLSICKIFGIVEERGHRKGQTRMSVFAEEAV